MSKPSSPKMNTTDDKKKKIVDYDPNNTEKQLKFQV